MKSAYSLLITALCCFLTVKAQLNVKRQSDYHYTTTVVSGLPSSSSIHSELRVSLLAKVVHLSESRRIVQFQDITLQHAARPDYSCRSNEVLDCQTSLVELGPAEAKTINKFLGLPFQMNYTNGQVLGLSFDHRDVFWSESVKQGFAYLFEVDLTSSSAHPAASPELNLPSVLSQQPYQYFVYEPSPAGFCKTMYNVRHSEKQEISVIKSRDYKQCIRRPFYLNTMFEGIPIDVRRQEDNPLSVGVNIEYILKGTRQSHKLLSAVSSGRIVFAPNGNVAQALTSVNQTLYMIEELEDVDVIPEIHNPKTIDLSVQMTQSQLSETNNYRDIHEKSRKIQAYSIFSPDKIISLLEIISQNTDELPSYEANDQLRYLINVVRKSSEQVLTSVWAQLNPVFKGKEDNKEDLLKATYWDVLSKTGTTSASKLILKTCTEQPQHAPDCNSSIIAVSLKTEPTPYMVNLFVNLVEKRFMKPEKITSEVKSAYLGLGTIYHKYRLAAKERVENLRQTEELINSIIDKNEKQRQRLELIRKQDLVEITEIINTMQGIESRLLLILQQLIHGTVDQQLLGFKTLTNAGLSKALPLVREFLLSDLKRARDVLVRVQAVHSLHRMTESKQAKQKTAEFLLELYLNTLENYSVRNSAFYTLLYIFPEDVYLNAIADSLRYEKDAQVSGYVFSFMETLGNSTYEPYAYLIKKCAKALQIANKRVLTDMANVGMLSSFSAEQKQGNLLRWQKYGDASGFMTKSFGVDTYLYGYAARMIELELNTHSISEVIQKLFGPQGLLMQKWFDSTAQATDSGYSPVDKIENIFKQLGVNERTFDAPEAVVSLKMMNNEISYIDLAKAIRYIMFSGNVRLPPNGLELPIDYKMSHQVQDLLLTLPTEAGFPVSLKLSSGVSANFQGKLDVQLGAKQLQIDLDLMPRVVKSVRGAMGLDWFNMEVTAGYTSSNRLQLPIKNRFFFNFKHNSFSVTTWPKVLTESPIVKVNSKPLVEVLVLPQSDDTPLSRVNSARIYATNHQTMLPIKRDLDMPVIGHSISVEGQCPADAPIVFPLIEWNGLCEYNVLITPLQDPPKSIYFYGLFAKNIPEHSEVEEDQETTENLFEDPMTIEDSLTVYQLARRIENRTERSLYLNPCDLGPEASGFFMLLHAPGDKGTNRYLQAEGTFTKDLEEKYYHSIMRFWRSPIKGYYDKTFQAVTQLGLLFSLRQYTAEDVYSLPFQQEVMFGLENLVSDPSHQIINSALNISMMTRTQQGNYPAMSTTGYENYRLLDGMVPQQLLAIENSMNIPTVDWRKYWRNLLPVVNEIQEYYQQFSDHNCEGCEEDKILEVLDNLLQVQQELLKEDLTYISEISNSTLPELPVLQWIVYKQSAAVTMLNEIIERASYIIRFNNVRKFQRLVAKSNTLRHRIIKKLYRLYVKIVTEPLLQRRQEEQEPLEVEQQNNGLVGSINKQRMRRKKTQAQREAAVATPSEENEDLLQALVELTMKQMKVIRDIESAIISKSLMDLSEVDEVVFTAQQTLDSIDSVLDRDVIQPDWQVFPDQDLLMLVNVQNLLVVKLLDEYLAIQDFHGHQNTKSKGAFEQINVRLSDDARVHLDNTSIWLKVQSYYLGQRLELVYRHQMVDTLLSPVVQVPEELDVLKQAMRQLRFLTVRQRSFQKFVYYNDTTLMTPEVADNFYQDFIVNVKQSMISMVSLIHDLEKLPVKPSVHVLYEVMSVAHKLKHFTEYLRDPVNSASYNAQYDWIRELDDLATTIQLIFTSFTPVFEKFQQLDSFKLQPSSISLNKHENSYFYFFALQNTLSQKMLAVQHSAISNRSNSAILKAIENILHCLKRAVKKLDAVDISTPNENSVTLFIKALNEQSLLHDKFSTLLSMQKDELTSEVSYKVLQEQAAELDQTLNEINHKLASKLEQQESRIKNVDLNNDASANLIPASMGASGSFEFSWGYDGATDNSLITSIETFRSVEQALWVYEQLNGITREQDQIYAVNQALAHRPWDQRSLNRLLNTYDHLHLTSYFEQDPAPHWIVEYLRNAQDYLKFALWGQYSRHDAQVNVDDNTLHVMMDVSRINQKVDMYFLSHKETDKFYDIDYRPYREKSQLNITDTVIEKIVNGLTESQNKELEHQCEVNGAVVNTFDKVTYNLPYNMTDCETVLAMDCSADMSFAITMAKHKQYQRVKIITGEAEIEIVTRGRDMYNIFANGSPYTLTELQGSMIFSAQVSYIDTQGKVQVYLPLNKINIIIWDEDVKIQLLPLGTKFQMYQHRVCGLCGNLDFEISDEFEAPSGDVMPTVNNFVNSYILTKQCPNWQRLEKTGHHLKGSVGGYSIKPCYNKNCPTNRGKPCNKRHCHCTKAPCHRPLTSCGGPIKPGYPRPHCGQDWSKIQMSDVDKPQQHLESRVLKGDYGYRSYHHAKYNMRDSRRVYKHYNRFPQYLKDIKQEEQPSY